ncbi:MAG: hypothetical protein ACPL1Y_06625 [Thermoplasmata archaeon]
MNKEKQRRIFVISFVITVGIIFFLLIVLPALMRYFGPTDIAVFHLRFNGKIDNSSFGYILTITKIYPLCGAPEYEEHERRYRLQIENFEWRIIKLNLSEVLIPSDAIISSGNLTDDPRQDVWFDEFVKNMRIDEGDRIFIVDISHNFTGCYFQLLPKEGTHEEMKEVPLHIKLEG